MSKKGLTSSDRLLKRSFDVITSFIGLITFSWIIGLAFIAATLDTRQNGFFLQERVGKDGRLFHTIKIRTMRRIASIETTVTTAHDARITKLGHFLRQTKIDELPQLINVLVGQMSLVGPRPDVPGFADRLTEADQIILTVRPGITGPATLQFRDEEQILAQQSDPEAYNREVIYPAKTRINRHYVESYSFWVDIRCLVQTILRV